MDIIDVREGKKVGGGGEGEKGNQIKDFYYVNCSWHRAYDRSSKKSQISWDFQRQIRRKIWVKFSQKVIAKKANFAEI